LNQEGRWDKDGDGLVDEIYHTITDRDCTYDVNGDYVITAADKLVDVDGDGINDVTYHDGDGDNLLDVMAHTYLYSSNQVTSCNLNRDYNTNALASKQCKPAQAPYVDPSMVPGYVP
jgi:hypothetical protein